MSTCPKCDYQRQDSDSHIHSGVCPKCGIAYQKYIERQQRMQALASGQPTSLPEQIVQLEPEAPDWRERIRLRCIEVPQQVDASAFWARALGWCVLLGLTLRFTFAGINWEVLGGSFFHNMILPFHEFGHVLFSPFGRFMTILGGSLFQVTMPLGLMVAFIWKQRETYGAMVMLWWSGQSFVDLSPYILDAVDRNLPLVGGGGEESHDWGNLLTMTHMLAHTQGVARLAFCIGVLLMLTALVWGAYLLKLQYHLRRKVKIMGDVDV